MPLIFVFPVCFFAYASLLCFPSSFLLLPLLRIPTRRRNISLNPSSFRDRQYDLKEMGLG
jgi:hypothetical protein